MRNARLVWLMAMFLFACRSVQADCPGSSVAPESIVLLGDAGSLSELDSAFNRIGATDRGLLGLYRTRRLALNPTSREELRFLRALPLFARGMSRIYELTYAKDVCEHPTVAETVYNMFDRAAELVRRHGRSHREFIELCLATDGEVGESAWPAFDSLLEEEPEKMVQALRSLPRKTRADICDGKDPRVLTKNEAVRVCQTGL